MYPVLAVPYLPDDLIDTGIGPITFLQCTNRIKPTSIDSKYNGIEKRFVCFIQRAIDKDMILKTTG